MVCKCLDFCLGVESSRLGLGPPLLGNCCIYANVDIFMLIKFPMFPNSRFHFPSLLYDISKYTHHNNVLSIIHNNACSLFWQSLSLTPGPWRQFPASLFLLLLVLFLLLVVARGNAPLAVSSRHLSVLPATLLPSAYLTSKKPSPSWQKTFEEAPDL